jgi:hypothetical protein
VAAGAGNSQRSVQRQTVLDGPQNFSLPFLGCLAFELGRVSVEHRIDKELGIAATGGQLLGNASNLLTLIDHRIHIRQAFSNLQRMS